MTSIPRRASIEDHDVDRDAAARWCICVDGAEQKSVVAFDMDAGTVTRHRLDKDGNAQPDETGKSVAIETIVGVVAVS